jgi:hypothetical protein
MDRVTLVVLMVLCVLICFAAYQTADGGFARLFAG